VGLGNVCYEAQQQQDRVALEQIALMESESSKVWQSLHGMQKTQPS